MTWTWTQAICAARWNQDYAESKGGNYVPVNWDEFGTGDVERCCYCNKPTVCGIYVRLDPTTVPYPREEPL